MAIDPQGQKYTQQIGQSGQQAATSLLQGGARVQNQYDNLQNAVPGMKQNFAGQQAMGVAAGAAHSGRQGGSAYGGAMQGGLQAAQQAANFEISSAQGLADMAAQQANLSSQGYATEAAAAGKMLDLQGRDAANLMQVNKQISDLIAASTGFFGDDTDQMGREFDRLIQIYTQTGDTNMVAYLQGEREKTLSYYSGING